MTAPSQPILNRPPDYCGPICLSMPQVWFDNQPQEDWSHVPTNPRQTIPPTNNQHQTNTTKCSTGMSKAVRCRVYDHQVTTPMDWSCSAYVRWPKPIQNSYWKLDIEAGVVKRSATKIAWRVTLKDVISTQIHGKQLPRTNLHGTLQFETRRLLKHQESKASQQQIPLHPGFTCPTCQQTFRAKIALFSH